MEKTQGARRVYGASNKIVGETKLKTVKCSSCGHEMKFIAAIKSDERCRSCNHLINTTQS